MSDPIVELWAAVLRLEAAGDQMLTTVRVGALRGAMAEFRQLREDFRLLRQREAMRTCVEVQLTGDDRMVPLYYVRHPDGSFSPAAPQPVGQVP